MRRIRLTLCYDGTDFHGWQIQPEIPTIQGTLEQVLSGIEGSPVHITGSGRTDAGVHALAQVAAFSFNNPIPPGNLRRAINRLLPSDIRILSAEEVAPDFHPRHHALAKTYEYRIFRGEVCLPFERRYVLHYPYPLNTDRMEKCASFLDGVHDFTAFAASDKSDADGLSKIRTIFSSGIERQHDRIIYRVRGSGFLKHMVRNIVGTLLEAGKGNIGNAEIEHLLSGRCGTKAGPTVPPGGLFLVSVEY